MFRISITLIHRTVDFLLGLTNQALPAPTTGRWQLFRVLFLQARTQFGLSAAFFPITFVPLAQFALHGPIVVSCTGSNEVCYADIDAHDGSIWCCVGSHGFIIGKGEPPGSIALIELYTAVELSILEGG